MLRVQIPKEKLEEALNFAHKRNRKQDRFGTSTYGLKHQPLAAHEIGIVAELAVAHYFGLDFDKRIFEFSGDDGTDLVVPNVGIVAVKATTYKKNPLLRAEAYHHTKDIAVYIACYVNPSDVSDVSILGWEWGSEVEKKTPRRLLKDGPLNYILEEKELQGIERLKCLADCSVAF